MVLKIQGASQSVGPTHRVSDSNQVWDGAQEFAILTTDSNAVGLGTYFLNYCDKIYVTKIIS